MKLLPFISLFFIALLAAPSLASSTTYITPTKDNVTGIMLDYNLDNQNNSYQLACEIGQYVSEGYGWNCDIRELKFATHSPVYINVFYPAADNKKEYQAYYGWFGPQKKEVISFWTRDQNKNVVMYYRDWGSTTTKYCQIVGCTGSPIVKSYFGNVAEENETTQPVNNTTQPVEYTAPTVKDVPVVVIKNPVSVDNSTVIDASGNLSGIMNSNENSSGFIENQGNGNWFQQIEFKISNLNFSNMKNSTINFFVGQ